MDLMEFFGRIFIWGEEGYRLHCLAKTHAEELGNADHSGSTETRKADSGREGGGMSEARIVEVAAESRRSRRRSFYGVTMGLLVFPAVAFAARKTSLWPNTILGFAALGVPFLLVGLRCWNRLLYPAQVPIRWDRDDWRGERLGKLDLALTWTWILSMGANWAVNESRHSMAYMVTTFLFCGAAGWSICLRTYLEDRRYLAPPQPAYDPSRTWDAEMTAFESEHWGERRVDDAGDGWVGGARR